MKQITTMFGAACMTLAAFAQTPSTVGVALQPRTARVVGSGTNLFTANSDRAVATIDTVARLATLTNAFHGAVVDVRGYATEFDWPIPLRYTLATNSAASTNRFAIAHAGSNGRWLHNWNGGADAFGVSDSSTNNTDAINAANLEAIDRGIPLTLPEGSLKVGPPWVSLVSGSHIRGKGMGRTILLRVSADASQTNTHVHATLQTPGVFNPYATNGGHGADVTASVSDITLEDFSISEASGSYSGFPIALMAAEDSTIQRVEVYGVTNHWAITLHGNRMKAVDNRIDNTGRIYQDGIHYLGGRDCIISRNFIRSGDDSIAISSAWATDPNIKNILVSDNSLYSSHGHVLRVFQENGSATNQFDGLRFVNNSGLGGVSQNGIVRFSSSSSNITYGLRDISVSKSAFQMGSFADHSSDPNKGGFGIYAEDCQGLKFENLTVGSTVFESFRIISCDDVEMNNVTAVGATYSSFFNNTVRVENTRKVSINGGDLRNVAGYGSQLIALANVTSAQVSGAFLSNSVLAGGVIGCFSNSAAVAPGMVAMFGNVIHSRSRAMANSYFDPTNFVFTGNEFLGDNLIGFANGTTTPIPGHYIAEDNIGFHKGYFRTPRLQTTNSANMSQWFTDSSGYATMMGTNGLIKFATDEASAGTKSVRLAFQSISNNLPHLLVIHSDDGSFPYFRMGYGSSLNSSPRWWSFGNAGTNYTQGLETVRLDLPTAAGDLPIRVRIAGSNDVYRLRLSDSNTVPAGAKAVYID